VVVVPDVRELPLLEAACRLGATQLAVLVEGERASESLSTGAVVDQTPTPGRRVEAMGAIHVVVAAATSRVDEPGAEKSRADDKEGAGSG
jgi:beta-lactam-binding protein with PASTA domain